MVFFLMNDETKTKTTTKSGAEPILRRLLGLLLFGRKLTVVGRRFAFLEQLADHVVLFWKRARDRRWRREERRRGVVFFSLTYRGIASPILWRCPSARAWGRSGRRPCPWTGRARLRKWRELWRRRGRRTPSTDRLNRREKNRFSPGRTKQQRPRRRPL